MFSIHPTKFSAHLVILERYVKEGAFGVSPTPQQVPLEARTPRVHTTCEQQIEGRNLKAIPGSNRYAHLTRLSEARVCSCWVQATTRSSHTVCATDMGMFCQGNVSVGLAASTMGNKRECQSGLSVGSLSANPHRRLRARNLKLARMNPNRNVQPCLRVPNLWSMKNLRVIRKCWASLPTSFT